MAKWPRDNQDDLIRFYGDPATEVGSRLVKVIPPFRMTYDGKPLSHLTFHRLAAPALGRALQTVWDYYGRDQKKIDALGISKTAGTYAPRMIRGSTTKWSNHAYGAAIDINAEENGFNVAGNIPIPMIAAFKAEGARWGGDYKNRTDPMHFEFCESGEPVRTFEQWLAFYKAKPAAPAAKPIPKTMRRRMMEAILGYEGRFTADGKLQIKIAPDGLPEIGGITQKDHPGPYASLERLLAEGKQDQLKEAVLQYYEQYTAAAQTWTGLAGVEFFLRDCILNRGPTGAAEILQMALGVDIDHQIGPTTRGALAALTPNDAIDKLRAARERYEDKKYPSRRTSNQWQGMLNRWNNAQAQAKAFQKEQGYKFTPEGKAAGGIIGGGIATAAEAARRGVDPGVIIWIVIGACVAAGLAYFIVRKIRSKS